MFPLSCDVLQLIPKSWNEVCWRYFLTLSAVSGCFLGVFLTEYCEEEGLLGVVKIVSICFVVGLVAGAVYVAKVIDEFCCVLGRIRILDSGIEIG